MQGLCPECILLPTALKLGISNTIICAARGEDGKPIEASTCGRDKKRKREGGK